MQCDEMDTKLKVNQPMVVSQSFRKGLRPLVMHLVFGYRVTPDDRTKTEGGKCPVRLQSFTQRLRPVVADAVGL